MVEKTSDSSDSDVELFDSNVMRNLRGARDNGKALFFVAYKYYVILP
jgi:hypothetical protein